MEPMEMLVGALLAAAAFYGFLALYLFFLAPIRQPPLIHDCGGELLPMENIAGWRCGHCGAIVRYGDTNAV